MMQMHTLWYDINKASKLQSIKYFHCRRQSLAKLAGVKTVFVHFVLLMSKRCIILYKPLPEYAAF